jgi:hypothetical protein
LIFSKSFDNHGYIRIFVFTKKSRLWILRIALMITVGVCSSVVRILVFFNTRWGGSCKILKFDLHAWYQFYFFSRFFGPTWYQYFGMASTPRYQYSFFLTN